MKQEVPLCLRCFPTAGLHAGEEDTLSHRYPKSIRVYVVSFNVSLSAIPFEVLPKDSYNYSSNEITVIKEYTNHD